MTSPLRDLHITPVGSVNGLAAEVHIDGLALCWQVISIQVGADQWDAFTAHSTPDGGWTGLTRLAGLSHRAPRNQLEMLQFCEWFFAPKREERP